MSTFKLSIVTPDGEKYSGEIEYLSYHAPDGAVGVMRGALPRIAVLDAGELKIKTSVLDMTATVGDGFVFVDKDGVTVLAENCTLDGGETYAADVAGGELSDGAYRTAKVKLASTVKRMKGGLGGR